MRVSASRLPAVAVFAFPLLTVFLLDACSVRQTLLLSSDGTGRLEIDVRLSDGFYGYLREMTEEARQLGYQTGDVVFDLEQLEASTAAFPGVRLESAEVPEPETLRVSFAVEDFQAAGRPFGEGPSLFEYTRRGNRGRFQVRLDRETYAAIRPLIPGSENPLFEVLGPQLEAPYTPEEYREVLTFMIGEEAPAWLEDSYLELLVRLPGPVLAQVGGRPVNGGVVFRVPLLEVLILNKDLSYWVEFELPAS
jgi:hypothetical protein